MLDTCKSARSYCRRQCCRKDETRSKAAHEITEDGRTCYVSADRPKRFGQRALDHRQALSKPFLLGNATATRSIEPDRMDLVEIGERSVHLGDVAELCNRCDIAVHRVDRFERNQFGKRRI